jgi:hypothetical protein
MAPQSKGVKNEKKNHQTFQMPIFKHQKNSSYVALLLLQFQDDL